MKGRLVLLFASAAGLSACATTTPPVAATDEAVHAAAEAPPTTDNGSAELQLAAAPTEPEPEAEPLAELPPPDLWQRLRAGFALNDHPDPRVDAELKYFSRQPDFVNRVVDRAEPYLHFIVEEVEKRGMPTEIALLPVVESAFQPYAHSHARAVGLWQFMPATGRRYGLKQNWWYDGRRDVVASTRAALDYLQALYDRFQDWELALASYNAGEGRVARAIAYNKQRGKPTDYWSLRLPKETRSYVPRLLAVRHLFERPEEFSVTLRSLPDEPFLGVVDVGSQIELTLAAQLAELSVEELQRLNPGFSRWATDPAGPHLLLLPRDRVDRFEQKLAEVPDNQRVTWERHQVRSGETLSHIAVRYGTTVAMIKDVNKLHGNNIRVGAQLLIPSGPANPKAVQAATRYVHAAPANRQIKRNYTVRQGDSLWTIARRHDVSVAQLSKWNGLRPRDALRVGRTLTIWMSAPVPAKLTAVSTNGGNYTVRPGDSLYVIAKRFGVSVSDLQKWNNLGGDSLLMPGQQLIVQNGSGSGRESI